jgi:hypothetical protein
MIWSVCSLPIMWTIHTCCVWAICPLSKHNPLPMISVCHFTYIWAQYGIVEGKVHFWSSNSYLDLRFWPSNFKIRYLRPSNS